MPMSISQSLLASKMSGVCSRHLANERSSSIVANVSIARYANISRRTQPRQAVDELFLRTALDRRTVSHFWRPNHAINVPPALSAQASPRACVAASHLDLALTLALHPAPTTIVDGGSAVQFAVNAPLLPEVLARREASPQADLLLTAEGVLRYIWESKFGDMLIEVQDGRSFVNGQAVEPLEPKPQT